MNNSKNLLTILVSDKKLLTIFGGIMLAGAILISLVLMAGAWYFR
jgi:hypothetical protein